MAMIRFFKPTLKRKDMDAVLQTMVDEKIGPGERRAEFLRLVSVYVGKKDGLALRSYVDALTLSLKALSLEKGAKVIISVLSPEVYRPVLESLELTPMLCDINSSTGCLSLSAIQKAANEGAAAVLLHEPLCQLPLELDDLKDLGLPVIEDISQSIGSSLETDETLYKAGVLGDIVVCAFEEDNVISTGGGAVALSSKQALLERLKAEAKKFSPYIDLPDMNAALGIIQLGNLPALLERRNELYKHFSSALMKTGNSIFGEKNIDFISNGHVFPCIVNGRPDEIIAFAQKYDVSCKRSFAKSVGARYQDRFDLYPEAAPALSRGLSFPLYPFLSQKDIDVIIKVLSHLPG